MIQLRRTSSVIILILPSILALFSLISAVASFQVLPSLETKQKVFSLHMGGYTSDVMNGGAYWNRETSKRGDYSGPIVKEARIIALSDPKDDFNNDAFLHHLPPEAKLLGIGLTYDDVMTSLSSKKEEELPNVIFVSSSHPHVKESLQQLVQEFSSSLEWIHSRSAGIDAYVSSELASMLSSSAQTNIQMTNAKGMYSSTLAEYTMMAVAYFAKDLPRLIQQQSESSWKKYPVEEIRGQTIGIIGYGDIGRAIAKLAKAYGMTVVATRRNPKLSQYDPYCDTILGNESLHTLMEQSDFIVVATPLTEETRGMVNKEALSRVKTQKAVIINVGRGPVIDEEALIHALQTGLVKGAALDVVTQEPLPPTSPLWNMTKNVLLSPHNMDQTITFMKESTDFFVQENIPRFVRNLPLLNPVNPSNGY